MNVSAHKVEVSTPRGDPPYLNFLGTEFSIFQSLKVGSENAKV